MIIEKVLNNSCVISLDDNGKEIVLLGNGIGFHKKSGDDVDKTTIDKVFVLTEKASVNHFAELMNYVPKEFIDLTEELIEAAHVTHGMQLEDSIHISLPDHIFSAIQNHKNGITIRNALLLETKKFYQTEYLIGQQALEKIEKYTGVKLPEDECAFIAMHFVNAQSKQENLHTSAMIILIDIINKMIEDEFQPELSSIDKESLVYCRYMTHLKFFAQRILTKTYFPKNNDDTVAGMIKKYWKEYECSRKICDFIESEYHYEVCKDELAYLALHIVQLTHLNKK